MVEYTCSICKDSFPTIPEAEKCEAQGLIGPEIEPGLVLSQIDKSLLVFYGELQPKSHERKYHLERVDFLDNFVLPWGESYRLASQLEELRKNNKIRVSTDEEVERLNQRLEDGVSMSSLIKVVLEKKGINKLHNRTDYFS